jgi:hypothetical protein
MRKKDVASQLGTIRWPPPPRFALFAIIGLLAIDTYLLWQILKELREKGRDSNDLQQPGSKNVGGENKSM